jgi:hypothetical protein
MLFVRFIRRGIYPAKKMERFPARMAIQDTDEPSSDRLIQEGRPHLRRLSFFSDFGIVYPTTGTGRLPAGGPIFPGFLKGSRYWLKKHRMDMPVDSQGSFDYFVFVIGLENP